MKHTSTPHAKSTRGGFTLFEAMLSLSVTAFAGTAVLLGLSSALQSTHAALDQAIATGMAQQLMDEIAGCYYSDPDGGNAYQVSLGPDAGELVSAGRAFDDIDDYHGLVDQPPSDRWGVPLGSDDGFGGWRHAALRVPANYFANWRREVSVFYIDETTLEAPVTMTHVPNARMAVVRVFVEEPAGGERLVAELQRVFAYVQAPE